MARTPRKTTKGTAPKAKRTSGRRPESAEETQARTAMRSEERR